VKDLDDDVAFEVMDTCVGCKACKTECPARIDVARAKVWWSDAYRKRHGATRFQRTIANLRVLSKAGALANPVLKSKTFKRMLGIAPQRELPPVRRLRMETGTNGPLLFGDCFTTYQSPEIAHAAKRLIPSLALTDAGCCGRVMLSEGFLEKARSTARRTAAALRATSGPLLFAEPSCMSAITDDWTHLIGDVSDIVERCALVETAVETDGFVAGGKVMFHPHCHQRALWGADVTVDVLKRVEALEIEQPDSGCCGMAGGFGYRADRYELSVAMGERVLAPAVRDTDAEIVATGTSCRHQIKDLTGREAVHPIVFLARRLTH
jgi:Fe-S oxidoreductase